MAPFTTSPDAVETHISRLFFTPDRVFKLLKPVDLGFLSFVDVEDRLAAAEAEFRLNHRVSPDVYLGLADVAEGETITDRFIVMRRLPADRQLDRLVDDHDLAAHLRDTARLIATFHSRQEPVLGDEAWMATADSLIANWNDNLAALEPLAGPVIPSDDFDRVAELAAAYVAGRGPLFAQRVADGRVRDGHGDLRAEHVFCLDDGPQLIDCLAFHDRYRIADVLNDIAFLAMDLHRLAGPWAAETFVAAYDDFTAEHHPQTLANHYIAYRAHVRAKVAAIRHGQGDPDAAVEAAAYHRLALDHLEAGQVRLVLVGGGAGVGKSTVAEGLASDLGAVWLRSDEARSAVAVVGGPDDGFDAPGQGRYRPEATAEVYRAILDVAEGLLVRGESVVLDATWHAAGRRAWAREVAARVGAAVSEINCVVPLSVAKERITRRMATVYEPSQATPEVADYLAERFEPWPQADPVDTAGSISDAIVAALDLVRGR